MFEDLHASKSRLFLFSFLGRNDRNGPESAFNCKCKLVRNGHGRSNRRDGVVVRASALHSVDLWFISLVE